MFHGVRAPTVWHFRLIKSLVAPLQNVNLLIYRCRCDGYYLTYALPTIYAIISLMLYYWVTCFDEPTFGPSFIFHDFWEDFFGIFMDGTSWFHLIATLGVGSTHLASHLGHTIPFSCVNCLGVLVSFLAVMQAIDHLLTRAEGNKYAVWSICCCATGWFCGWVSPSGALAWGICSCFADEVQAWLGLISLETARKARRKRLAEREMEEELEERNVKKPPRAELEAEQRARAKEVKLEREREVQDKKREVDQQDKAHASKAQRRRQQAKRDREANRVKEEQEREERAAAREETAKREKERTMVQEKEREEETRAEKKRVLKAEAKRKAAEEQRRKAEAEVKREARVAKKRERDAEAAARRSEVAKAEAQAKAEKAAAAAARAEARAEAAARELEKAEVLRMKEAAEKKTQREAAKAVHAEEARIRRVAAVRAAEKERERVAAEAKDKKSKEEVRITSSKRAEAAKARAADEDVRRERAAEEMRGRQESNMRNANQAEVAPVEELDTDLVSFLKMYGLAHLVELFAGEELDTQSLLLVGEEDLAEINVSARDIPRVMEMKDALERYIREDEDSTNVAAGDGGGGGAVELDDYPPEFVCPITHDLMENPVVCADGISYSEADIREWLNRGHSTSPLTGAELAHLHLTPNYALKSQIARWRDEHKQ
mmetsp:Transcript_32159/g.74254  ORF Transcript_32159/g.74254 Transcript_32159/m.74254 type:complete len:662 (+) Transcript_32159:1434-3419(+)